MKTRLLRTVFLVSTFAYMGFAYFDTLEPGVVSDVMSVHVWLVPVVVSGVWWATVAKDTGEEKGRAGRVAGTLAAVLVGLVLGGLLWHNGDMFGDFRLLLAVGAAALPILAHRTLMQS